MEKRRILYVEQSRVGTTGGSHTCLLDLVKRLDRQKYEPIVMFYEENDLVQEFKEVALRVLIYTKPTMLNIASQFRGLTPGWLRPLFLLLLPFQKAYNFILSFRPFLDFIGFLRREKIDIVHLNNSFYTGYDWLVASKLCRVVCITHQRGLQATPCSGRFFIKLYDGIICVSEHIRQELQKNYLLVDGSIRVIYDGLDLRSFTASVEKDPVLIREEFGFQHDDPLIGLIGNIKPWKGQRVAIDAVELLKKKYSRIRCLLIGNPAENPEYFEALKAAVISKKLTENVLFVGFRKDVHNLINALDILVHTSIKAEPFGRVLLEGMALGRPVIATKIGGPLEIIEDCVSGYLVPPNDPATLARAIDVLLDDPELRKKIGDAARQRVETSFSPKQTLRDTERFYAELFGENN